MYLILSDDLSVLENTARFSYFQVSSRRPLVARQDEHKHAGVLTAAGLSTLVHI